jgi:hypothetical protein
MHAVLITFTSSASLADVAEPFERYAYALQAIPGLVMKTWIAEDTTLGGFHIFTDRASADAYLGGDLLATVANNPVFSNFAIRHFDVIDSLSALNGSPIPQAA